MVQSVGRKLPQNYLPPKHPDLHRKDPVTGPCCLRGREGKGREGAGAQGEGKEKRRGEEGWRKDRPSILKPQLCIGIPYLCLQVTCLTFSSNWSQILHVVHISILAAVVMKLACCYTSLLPLALHSTALGSSHAVSATSPSSSTSLSTMETQLN